MKVRMLMLLVLILLLSTTLSALRIYFPDTPYNTQLYWGRVLPSTSHTKAFRIENNSYNNTVTITRLQIYEGYNNPANFSFTDTGNTTYTFSPALVLAPGETYDINGISCFPNPGNSLINSNVTAYNGNSQVGGSQMTLIVGSLIAAYSVEMGTVKPGNPVEKLLYVQNQSNYTVDNVVVSVPSGAGEYYSIKHGYGNYTNSISLGSLTSYQTIGILIKCEYFVDPGTQYLTTPYTRSLTTTYNSGTITTPIHATLDLGIYPNYSYQNTHYPTPGVEPDLFEDTSITFTSNYLFQSSSHPYTVEWDFSYNGTFITEATGGEVTHTFTTPGTYTVALKVADQYGFRIVTRNLIINAIPTPSAVFTGTPVSGTCPLTVNFSAPQSGLVHPSTRYAWDYDNDGVTDETTSESTISHTYTRTGVYSVKCSVKNVAFDTSYRRSNYINVYQLLSQQSTTTTLNNYPNPFNPSTTISFDLATEQRVNLFVYNTRGQRVATLLDNSTQNGHVVANWTGKDDNGKSVSSGIYYCVLKGKNIDLKKKMILIK